MAESMSTPTKISARNPVCKLCGGSHETRFMLRTFSKAGISKDLCSKVYKACSINISEDDTRSAVLCRSGVTFVDKIDRSVYSESSICRQYAVWSKLRTFCRAMRSTFTVFASAVKASIKGYATRKLRCGSPAIKGVGRPTRLLPYAKMLLVSISFFPLLGRLMLLKVLDFHWANVILAACLTHRFTVWFLFLVGRICPLMHAIAFSLTSFDDKAFYNGWIRVLKFFKVPFGSE